MEEARGGDSGAGSGENDRAEIEPATGGATPPEPAEAEPAALGALDVLYGVLFRPRATFRALAGRAPLRLALVVVLLTAGLQSLTLLGGRAEDDPLAGMAGLVAAPLSIPIALLAWFVLTAVWHLTAELLGGVGSARSALALVGLASLPGIFGPPLELLGRATGVGAFDLLGMAAGIWSLVLDVLAVQAAYGLSGGRSLLVVLMPVLVIAVLIGVLVGIVAAVLSELGPSFPLD